MPNIKIPAPEGIQTHKGTAYEVELREPTLDDVMEIGEIASQVRTPEGSVMIVENKANIRAYFERCLVSPPDPILVGQASLAVGLAIKGAIIGFFLNAHSRAEPSTTSGETSGRQDGSPPAN